MIQLNIYESNSACLIGVFYQPSSDNNKKRIWIEKLDLNKHISKASRIEKKLIDRIISNTPANKVPHSDVLRCPTISDHNAPYIIANMPVNKFETRHKYIRNLKSFELEKMCLRL